MEEEYFKKFADDLEERQNKRIAEKKQQEVAEKNSRTRDLNKKLREDPGNRTIWSR